MSITAQEHKSKGTHGPKGAKILVPCVLMAFAVLLFSVCIGCQKTKDNKVEKTEFEIDKVYERGPLTVHVRIDKSKITIAETLLLELQAAIGADYEVQMPKVDKVLESFGIIDWDNLGNELDVNNNVVSRYRYRLEPFLSGTYAIPAFTFEFHDVKDAEGKKYELQTEPIDIEVASLLGQQRGELVIADIEGVVDMTKEAFRWWAWPAGGICVIAAVGIWLYLRRKKVKEVIRIFKPAHEIAYDLLRALVKDNLIKKGKVKEFYERISNILRHYIEHRFFLRASERTTEEFLNEIQQTDILSKSDKENLGEFLRHCDLVKFAKYNPTKEQIQETFDLVKNFIEQTKSDERKVDVTDTITAGQAVEVGSA